MLSLLSKMNPLEFASIKLKIKNSITIFLLTFFYINQKYQNGKKDKIALLLKGSTYEVEVLLLINCQNSHFQ